jgi:hypothetical protein
VGDRDEMWMREPSNLQLVRVCLMNYVIRRSISRVMAVCTMASAVSG